MSLEIILFKNDFLDQSAKFVNLKTIFSPRETMRIFS